MDDTTRLTEGAPPDPDESILKSGTDDTGSFATPVHEPVVTDPLQALQGLWPDTESITPAPVSASSKLSIPVEPEPVPGDTPSEHVSAASLITPSVSDTQPVAAPPLGFDDQSVPDPRARISAFADTSSLGLEPTQEHASPTGFPSLETINTQSTTPAIGDRLSAFRDSSASMDAVSRAFGASGDPDSSTFSASGISGTSGVSGTPAVAPPAAREIPVLFDDAKTNVVEPSIPSTPATSSETGASTASTASAVFPTLDEPAAPVIPATPVIPVPSSTPTTFDGSAPPSAPVRLDEPVAPSGFATSPAAYGEFDQPAGQGIMDFGNTVSDEPAGWTNAQESVPSVPTPAPAPAPAPAATSGFGAGDDVPLESSPVMEQIEKNATEAAEQITREQLIVASSDQLARESDVPEPTFGEPIEVEEEPVEKGISVITREATVLGDIITEGHIDIVGRVKGNIDAKGDVAIHGIVRGDVDGSKIGLYSCRVKGNLNAGLGVIVDDSSIIGGDVKTKNIIFDGKVKGNIDADNVVVLRSHSYCLGDVSAASLAVEPGAILNGKVRTFVDGDLEAPFDEVM